MALPRKILNALRAGQYTPSSASKKAREAATRLQNQRNASTSVNTGLPSGQPRDTFRSVKNRTIQRKHAAFYGTQFYDPRGSIRMVEGSDEYEAMRQTLGLSEEQMYQLASLASKAHAELKKSGDAGELEIYLKYDFLFYHLYIPKRNGNSKYTTGKKAPKQEFRIHRRGRRRSGVR